MRLLTYKKKGRDITEPDPWPLTDYIKRGGAYYDISRFLGWTSWVWCFEHESDFFNEYMRPVSETVKTCDLWELDVPAECIKWCALRAQCENRTPVKDWFYLIPEAIRRLGDIPQGLVRNPVRPEWVKEISGVPRNRAFEAGCGGINNKEK
jgi:hypothetical protein